MNRQKIRMEKINGSIDNLLISITRLNRDRKPKQGA